MKPLALSEPVQVSTSDGIVRATAREYVRLTIEVPCVQGTLVLHQVAFVLVDSGPDAKWDIYLGIPILAHLGILPTQSLDNYIIGELHRDCFSIPLFYQRKTNVSITVPQLMIASSSSIMTNSGIKSIADVPDSELHSLINSLIMDVQPENADTENIPVEDLPIPDELEEDVHKDISDQFAKSHKLYALLNAKLKFEDKEFQKREDLLLALSKAAIKFKRASKKERQFIDQLARANRTPTAVKNKMLESIPTITQFIEFLIEYSDVWRTEFGDDPHADVPPLPNKWDPSFNNGNGPVKGVKRSRRLSDDQLVWLAKHLQALQRANVIEEILPNDQWVQRNGLPKACAIFLVPKKDGDWRLIEDFRNVNVATEKFDYCMLDVRDSMSYYRDCTHFAILDALKGYNQFPASEELSYSLVITTPDGKLYRFKALPMGYINSAQWYSFCMNSHVLKDLVRKCCLAYLDDILAYAKSGRELLDNLKLILDACRAKGVKLNIKKSQLYNDNVVWCGRKISRGGNVSLPDESVKSVLSIERPDNARTLQQFVCSMNWFSAWIPQYTDISRPLVDLMERCYELASSRSKRGMDKITFSAEDAAQLTATRLTHQLAWTREHTECFERLKKELKNHIALTAPKQDWDRNILLDASDHAWSLIITQTHPSQYDKDIVERDHEILHISSGKFTGNSKNWHVSEKEAYGIFRAVRDVEWLMHSSKPVHIYTDHRNLLKLFRPYFIDADVKKPAASRLLRWSLMLMGCNYKIHSIEGRKNIVADYLSRFRKPEHAPSVRVGSSRALTDVSKSESKTKSRKRKYDQIVPKTLTREDPAAVEFRKARVRPLLSNPDHFYINEEHISNAQQNALSNDHTLKLPDGYSTFTSPAGYKLITVNGKIFVPKFETRALVARMIIISHISSGHRGLDVVAQNLKDKYYFEEEIDKVAIAQFARECLHCQPRVSYFRRPLGKLLQAKHKNQIIHMDYFYVSDSPVYKYILVIMDNFTQFVHLVNCASPDAETAAAALIEWESLHGFRSDTVIATDQGSHFTASIIAKLCQYFGVQQHFSVANTPWTNATIERVNSTIKSAFQSLMSQTRLPTDQWYRVTPVVQNILNSMKRKTLAIDAQWKSPKGLMNCIPEDEIRRSDCIVSYLDKPHLLDISGYFADDNTTAVNKEFVRLADYFRTYYAQLSEVKQSKIIAQQAARNEFFDTHLNFAPGDFVLVANHCKYNLKDQKVKFRWIGPAQIVEMHGHSLATVRYLYGAENTLDEKRTEIIHTSRLAFYSHEMEGVTDEVRIQILHDNNQFVIKDFISFEHITDSGGYGVKCSWEGFSEEFSSIEPLDQLFQDVPLKVLRWLKAHRSESSTIDSEFRKLHKRYVEGGHKPLV